MAIVKRTFSSFLSVDDRGQRTFLKVILKQYDECCVIKVYDMGGRLYKRDFHPSWFPIFDRDLQCKNAEFVFEPGITKDPNRVVISDSHYAYRESIPLDSTYMSVDGDISRLMEQIGVLLKKKSKLRPCLLPDNGVLTE